MRAVNILLALLMSAVLAGLVLEGGLRLVGFAPAPSLHDFDAELGWTKRPGAVGTKKTNEFRATYEINALGLRDDPASSPTKPAGVFRVLCLGDSFVLGTTVERRDLFCDLLENLWQAQGRRVEVINAGTESAPPMPLPASARAPFRKLRRVTGIYRSSRGTTLSRRRLVSSTSGRKLRR